MSMFLEVAVKVVDTESVWWRIFSKDSPFVNLKKFTALYQNFGPNLLASKCDKNEWKTGLKYFVDERRNIVQFEFVISYSKISFHVHEQVKWENWLTCNWRQKNTCAWFNNLSPSPRAWINLLNFDDKNIISQYVWREFKSSQYFLTSSQIQSIHRKNAFFLVDFEHFAHYQCFSFGKRRKVVKDRKIVFSLFDNAQHKQIPCASIRALIDT